MTKNKTSADLRDILFDELISLRAGETSVAKSNAVVRLAEGIVGTVNMEMSVAKLLLMANGADTSIAMPATSPVQLGTK